MRRPTYHFVCRGAARLALALVAIGAGCDGLRRASLKTVDPTIQKNPRWEREKIGSGFRLGPYTVDKPRVRESAIDQDLGARTDAPRKPGWRYDVELTVHGPGGEYRARCSGVRVPTIAADYGEIADVNNDEVHIECDVRGAQRWTFAAQGRLDKNIGGELRAIEADAIAPMQLEILLWVARLKLIRRHLAAPVAQVRRGRDTVAALVISRPEWAWVAAGESTEIRGIALTTLLAVETLPLGFEE